MIKQKDYQMHKNLNKSFSQILKYCVNREQFKGKDISKSHLYSLISEILKIEKVKLFTDSKKEINFKTEKQILKKFFFLINSKPLSRILGKKEFFSRDFFINKYTLDPRPDTETLVEIVVKLLMQKKKKNIKALELGSGSGCVISSIAMELKKYRTDFNITGIDICENANKIAIKNVKNQGITDYVKILKSNWFSCLSEKFDLIYTNPPYISTGLIPTLDSAILFDPRIALDGGFDGLSCFREISKKLDLFMNPDSYFCTEIGHTQDESVKKIFKMKSLHFYKSYRDLEGRERCLVFHKKKV